MRSRVSRSLIVPSFFFFSFSLFVPLLPLAHYVLLKTQVEKLSRENQVAAAQLVELRKQCDALRMYLATAEQATPDPDSMLRRSQSTSGSIKPFGKLLSMGKNRTGTLGSSSSSPMAPRRPTESPPASLNKHPENGTGDRRTSVPSFTPPSAGSHASGHSSLKSPSRMTRADSMPSFSPLPFRERAGTTSMMPSMGGGRDGLTKSSKLAALLGEEIQEMPVEEGIVYMRDKDTDQVLIRGGTLDALIGKLITSESEGKAYTDSFLISYRSFIEPPALFEKLQSRFEETYSMPPDVDGSTVAQDRMRLKILAFFRTWVDKFYHDWEEFPTILEQYREWLNTAVVGAQSKVALQLSEAAERKTIRGGSMRLENQFDEPAPKPIRPPLGFSRATEVDPTEMARQFCLIESRLFQAIKPKEYLGKGWEAKNKEVVAPHLSAFIAHFNRMSNFVAASVVEAPDDRKRGQTIEFWVRVADRVFDMNNFAGLMEIVGGLGATSVVRLKKAWKGVSRNKQKTWDRLRELMGPQKAFASYRNCIRQAHAPLIPYLGVYMQDMVFLEDGNPDFLKEHPTHINFHKRRLLAEKIKDIQQHQLAPYNIDPVPEIIDFLALQSPDPETELYRKSLLIQPRESD